MRYAYAHEGPCAFRYPRGAFALSQGEFEARELELGKGEILVEGDGEAAFIAYGNAVGKANAARKILLEKTDGKFDPSLVDLVFVKPLDGELLQELARKHKIWYVFSDTAKKGGVGEILAAFLQERRIFDVHIVSFEFDDVFIPHGATADVEKALGIDAASICDKILAKSSDQI